MQKTSSAGTLLAWYDRHARVLPWRVAPESAGKPDPYRVWLSEIMLQQTGVAVVRDYFLRFTALWPDIHALAAAPAERVLAEWAGLGYYARARNLLKCARLVVREHGGEFPADIQALRDLPGIGPYTAAAIAAIAFGQAQTVVDGNVERVMARLFAVREPLPGAKPLLRRHATRLTPTERPGDYAQAVMDLGATICTPKNPKCGSCPWISDCLAHREGIQRLLPARQRTTPKPTRLGRIWVARRADGAWLAERRPQTGLLGGMLGWPGTDWAETEPDGAPPIAGDWHEAARPIRHTFTHFHLHLRLFCARLPAGARPDRGFFIPASDFRPSDLPSLMRKAHSLARTTLDADPGIDSGPGAL